jgi:hypothetical protein
VQQLPTKPFFELVRDAIVAFPELHREEPKFAERSTRIAVFSFADR